MEPRIKGIKEELKACLDEFDETIPMESVVENPTDEMRDLVNKQRETLKRLKRARKMMKSAKSANDVFSRFALDAAELKVMEAILAKNSSDRQRAQETILDRALGKAVDRTMTVNVDISNMSDGELDDRIGKLMSDLGYTTREGGASTLIIEAEIEDGGGEA